LEHNDEAQKTGEQEEDCDICPLCDGKLDRKVIPLNGEDGDREEHEENEQGETQEEILSPRGAKGLPEATDDQTDDLHTISGKAFPSPVGKECHEHEKSESRP